VFCKHETLSLNPSPTKKEEILMMVKVKKSDEECGNHTSFERERERERKRRNRETLTSVKKCLAHSRDEKTLICI
jgi:hypothetical protein